VKVHSSSEYISVGIKQTLFYLHYFILQDGITHPTDTALRDFSARCLHEFVMWSVKQGSPVNVKAILKQIYSFCLHPCPSKRLGE
jgi:hypothetical protein